MTDTEKRFHELAAGLPQGKVSKMFGATCVKAANGKAAFMIWQSDIVFKLEGDDLKEGLALDGTHIFDPRGGHPMGGWLHIPPAYQNRWKYFAKKSFDYVAAMPGK